MLDLKSHPALLIIDMQNGFCHEEGSFSKVGIPTAGARAIVPQIQRLRTACREHGVPVIYARYGMKADYSDAGLEFEPPGGAEIQAIGGFIRDTWDTAILDELTPAADEVIIDKNRSSMFFGTNLEAVLREKGINHVIVTGVASHVCVECTARDAWSHAFWTTTVRDATATGSVELHEASMRNMKSFGGTAGTEEVVEAVGRLKARS